MPPDNPLDPTVSPTPTVTVPPDNFTRQSLTERLEKAKTAQQEAESKIKQAAELVLQSEAGLIVFRYLFHLAGGGGDIQQATPEATMAMVARKDMYNALRNQVSSDNISKIERHFWE